MREIFTALFNVIVLIVFVLLLGKIQIFSAIQSLQDPKDLPPVECTLSVDRKTAIPRVESYPFGTDCDALRALIAAGKPLPPSIKKP
jgi:hypothetical protein